MFYKNLSPHVKALLDEALPLVESEREGTKETPDRYAKALETLTSGYGVDTAGLLKTFGDGAENYDSMVTVGSIQMYSLCEHHMLPFFGVAHVGYIPDKRIVGLSKIPRLVNAFAQRLQVQERLTTQIASTIQEVLQPKAVGVVVRCRHLCMEMRGVQKPGAVTFTSCLLGAFKDEPDARGEFLEFVKLMDRDLRI